MAPRKRPAGAPECVTCIPSAKKRPAAAAPMAGNEDVLCIPCAPGAPLTASASMIQRMFDIIENEVIPKTEKLVAEGNKMFGAAIMRDDPALTTVIADSNHEMLCPLYHGEIWTIKQWSEIPAEQRPAASECVFLATHEPCCLCISGITWAGFKKCFYFFSYEDSKVQGIPHDLNIMHQLWQVSSYAKCNAFVTTCGLKGEIDKCEEGDKAELTATAERITSKYEELAQKYHSEKVANKQNTLAFG